MATTDELAALHGRAQERIGALTVAEVAGLWRLLDVDDLDNTAPAWLAAVLGVVTIRREQSAALARRFMEQYRSLALPGAPPLPAMMVAPIDTAAVATSLRVTGPVAIKASMTRGVSRQVAVQAAQTMTTRSAERHALDGGVRMITDITEADPRASGWRRQVSGGACKFCSAPENQEGSGAFRRHDGCHCKPVPVYR